MDGAAGVLKSLLKGKYGHSKPWTQFEKKKKEYQLLSTECGWSVPLSP
jgi:hypothetical protein